MMGDVYAVNLIAFGITNIAIESSPSESEWRYEEIVEEPNVARHNGCTTYPPSP
jgi:hypothetical protein